MMLSWIWGLILGGFLIAHGLLHWRFDISQSWLLKVLGIQRSKGVGSLAVMLWVVAVLGFVATGLGVFGFPILHDSWRSLAIVSAVVSLLLLALAWHPWLTLGVLIDIGILVALLWGNWLPEG